ncbi:MAG: hypothetical protein Fur0022_05570 [Anaerolineales bacterium]
MHIQSLGYRINLIFPHFDGEVVDKGEYTVIRTPTNPGYFWGNFLLFAHPPQAGDLDRWQALFAQEIGTPPTITHLAFGWDSPEGIRGDIAPFLGAGFRLEEHLIMSAQAVHPPPKWNDAVLIRPIQGDQEWEQALDITLLCFPGDEFGESYRLFIQREMGRFRKMSESGWGHWFGAFLDNRMVAGLGLYFEHGLGSFELVGTHPDFQRQGICGTLVYRAAQRAFEEMGVHTLALAVDIGYHAERIYESVGFKVVERQVGMEKW